MTALLSLDSKNFTLACDGCGQLVTNLAPTMGDWAVAWSLFSQDGWTGDDVLVQAHRLSIAVCLVGPAQQIQDALRLLNLDRLFPSCLTVPEALSDGQTVDVALPSAGVPRPDRVGAL